MRGMRALRNFKPNRCYHLISRIANRAFYLTDEEACAFLEGKRPQDLEEVESRMREAAEKGDYEHAEAIGLKAPPQIIECVDISNLFGADSVASMVVARDGLPDGRYYRHFRVETIVGADDPRSLA